MVGRGLHRPHVTLEHVTQVTLQVHDRGQPSRLMQVVHAWGGSMPCSGHKASIGVCWSGLLAHLLHKLSTDSTALFLVKC